MAVRIRAVIPMKPLDRCKLRLAPILGADRRAQLTLRMLERVGRALRGAPGIAEVAVVGGDKPIQQLCERSCLDWYPDKFEDLNASLNGFYESASNSKCDAMFYVAGDLPALSLPDVEEFIEQLDDADLVLAPGARDGTNAVLLRLHLPFTFQLGEQSYKRHREQCSSLGLRCKSHHSEALFSDIDLPSDLAWLEREHPELWESISAPASSW
jgi:2-phospho-L-lactate guanylyltransferase